MKARFALIICAAFALLGTALFSLGVPAAAQEAGLRANVLVERAGQNALVRYQLTRPVTTFTFHEILTEPGSGTFRDILRDGRWQLVDQAFQLSAGSVTRRDGGPFDAFEIVVTPDSAQYGRIYPALVPLGEGVVIGLQYLAAARAQMETVISLRTSEGQIVLTGGQPPALELEVVLAARSRAELTGPYAPGGADEYVVFIGPQDYLVDTGAVRAVVDPQMPDWIVNRVLSDAAASARFYTEEFGTPAPYPPTFLMSYRTQGLRPRWRGDVSAGGLIAMRLTGAAWASENAGLNEDLSLFVAHEVNHLWNGRLFQHAGGDRDAWLHEGGAEYMAVKALHARGRLSDARFDQLMMRYVNGCIRELGRRYFEGVPGGSGIGGSAIYNCGAAIQWFAEAALVAEGRDIFDLWRELFAAADRAGEFGAADFFTSLQARANGAQAAAAIRLIVNAGATTDYAALEALLAPLDLQLRAAPERLHARRYVGRLLMPLMRAACVPPHDYAVRRAGARYVIDMPGGGRCAPPLDGLTGLTAIEGHDLFEAAVLAYDAAAVICARGGALTLTTIEETQLLYPCPAALPPRAPELALIAPWAARHL